MTKSLKALKQMQKCIALGDYTSDNEMGLNYSDLYDIVEKELKRLEQYDIQYEQNIKWLDLARKKLKAFEIIKEKRVDLTFFDTYIKWNWEKYQNREIKCSEKELTQEEFDLLKEVLKDD